jgi:hypothetical protein
VSIQKIICFSLAYYEQASIRYCKLAQGLKNVTERNETVLTVFFQKRNETKRKIFDEMRNEKKRNEIQRNETETKK